MPKLLVFNSVTLDGYFAGPNNEISWAHKDRQDQEWNDFVVGNASSGGVLMFGRITYQLMASYWPTNFASQRDPVVAQHMNDAQKVVFSRTLNEVSWKNTRLVKDDIVGEVRKMKEEPGPHIAIMGSGSIVKQLTDERLIDWYQIVVNPVALGAGRTMFDGVKNRLDLKLVQSRAFKNGNVLLTYER
jgi:dihydrofolate reductase